MRGELALGDDHDGIIVLEDRPEIGTSLNAVFPESDFVFDIEVTPNRPDCLSYIGIARELGAYFQLPVSFPEISPILSESTAPPPDDLLKGVRIETPENCPTLSRVFNCRSQHRSESGMVAKIDHCHRFEVGKQCRRCDQFCLARAGAASPCL